MRHTNKLKESYTHLKKAAKHVANAARVIVRRKVDKAVSVVKKHKKEILFVAEAALTVAAFIYVGFWVTIAIKLALVLAVAFIASRRFDSYEDISGQLNLIA